MLDFDAEGEGAADLQVREGFPHLLFLYLSVSLCLPTHTQTHALSLFRTILITYTNILAHNSSPLQFFTFSSVHNNT